MKSIFKTALLSTLLLVPSFLSAKTFEGTVAMSMSDGRNGSHEISYSIKGSKIRTEMQGKAGQNTAAILDLDQQQIIVLMPAQSMYMVMPMKQTIDKVTSDNISNDTTLENTGITKEILGYECTKYLAKSSDGVTEIWATDQLGTFMGLGSLQNPMARGKSKAAWEEAIDGKNFFPLLVITEGKGNGQFTLTTTAIEAKSLPQSLFVAPEGYRKFDMGAMMQGMGGKMFGQ